jgi:hypothetical protein
MSDAASKPPNAFHDKSSAKMNTMCGGTAATEGVAAGEAASVKSSNHVECVRDDDVDDGSLLVTYRATMNKPVTASAATRPLRCHKWREACRSRIPVAFRVVSIKGPGRSCQAQGQCRDECTVDRRRV